MSVEQKPICVVIDTSIWRQDSNLLLRTPMGSALRYILKQSSGKIGLPEIIEEELTRNTVEQGLEAVEKINKGFKVIEVIMGCRCFYEVPDEAQLQATVTERLTDLNDLIIRIPFTFEHAKSALRRINEKSQPNGESNQQFKDSAIWEAILTLSNSYIIYFISGDKAFFKGKECKTNELADNLLNDCIKIGGMVSIYNNMASCLKVLQKNVPPLNYSDIILKIDSVINLRLKPELVSEIGFEIAGLAMKVSSVSAFFTEMKGKLALSFELYYHCNDVQHNGVNERKDAILRTKGDCLYELDNQMISDIKMDFERIYWVEPSGEAGRRGIVYASGTMGGIEQVNYTFREPVDFIRFPNLDWKERVKKVRKDQQDFFKEYSKEARAVLETLLDKYAEEGVAALEIPSSIMKYSEFEQYGDIFKILELFGDERNLTNIVRQLQKLLYSV